MEQEKNKKFSKILSTIILLVVTIIIGVALGQTFKSGSSKNVLIICLVFFFVINVSKTWGILKGKKQVKGNIIEMVPQKNWYRCKNCDKYTDGDANFCVYCGTKIDKSTENFEMSIIMDNKYLLPEKNLLANFIDEEAQRLGINVKKLNNSRINLKKNILLLIFAIISLICLCMFFMNESLNLCVGIEIIALLMYIVLNKNYNAKNEIEKLAKENPDVEISCLISKMQAESKTNIPTLIKILSVTLAIIIIPCIYFTKPRTFYKKEGSGYSLIKYSRGLVNENKVTVPSTYKGESVISIGEGAFKNTSIEEISLPKSIEEIKKQAFYNCTSLRKIIIPENVTAIRGEAFAKCTSLKSVNLNEGLKEIRGGAFKECEKLYAIELPDSLEYLGASTFSYCSSLREITIPKNVTEINGQTFEYCTSLKTVNMHDNITAIHGEVFVNCTLLKDVVLPSKITEIKGNTFENCRSLTSINIPTGVKRIGGHAFYGCTRLASVTVPSTVTEIGSSAFRNCTSLKTIRIPKEAYINEKAFKSSPTQIIKY